MPVSRLATEFGVFHPEDVEVLRRVFAAACREQLVTPDAATREAIAARIMESFRRGVTEEQKLLRDAVLGFEEVAP